MKRLIILITACVICLCGCSSSAVNIPGNEKDYFAHVTMEIDETDPYAYAGAVDYIFAGTVTRILSNKITASNTKSRYAIQVDENIKGELKEIVEAYKVGGVRKDGLVLLVESDRRQDSGLPEEGKSYVFMAYAQEDGTLLLSEFFDDRECNEALIEEYREYYENEIPFERERYRSKYDISPEKTALKLGHFEDETIYDVPAPEHLSVSADASGLIETEWCAADESLLPEQIISVIHENTGIDSWDGWQMMIHYYNEEETEGLLQLRYAIKDRIITNKAVTCAIEGGKINDLYLTEIDGNADEEDLLKRVKKFAESTEQERYQFKENEEFIEETVQYTYNYANEALVYVYNLFFYEGEGDMRVINNSLGSEYLIP